MPAMVATCLGGASRFASHASASTSARTPPILAPPCAPPHRLTSPGCSTTQHPRGSVVMRITNTSAEVYKHQKMREEVEDDDDQIITVNEEQVLYPELGSLEGRVTKFYLDELFANTGPDLEETAYWFHTPPEGWKREQAKYAAAQEAPVTFADPAREAWEAEGRAPLSTLTPGSTITGTISDIWLYHGLQVDFGCEFDGLVPMTEEHWMGTGVRDALMPGDEVTCTVHAVRRPGLYRWPVQLALVAPSAMADRVMPPDEYMAPISHAWASDQGWGMEEILEATGRNYQPSTYILPLDGRSNANEFQRAFGFDSENVESMDRLNEMEDRVSLEYTQEISRLANYGPIDDVS